MFLQNFEDPPAPLFLASTVAQSKAILIPDPLYVGLFLKFHNMPSCDFYQWPLCRGFIGSFQSEKKTSFSSRTLIHVIKIFPFLLISFLKSIILMLETFILVF